MRYLSFFTVIIFLTFFFSCGNDDDLATSRNQSPEISSQSFNAAETVLDDVIIGTVAATDPEDSNLIYSIAINDNDLFEITADGALSLATGQGLDFKTANSHTITVEVSDGELSATAEITINVQFVVVVDPNAFITTWETTTASESITIPTNPDYTYKYAVDWGDGSTSEDQIANTSHTYTEAGTYTVSITGDFPAIFFNAKGDKNKIKTIAQWGAIEWKSMSSAFEGCFNIISTATDSPNLTQVTELDRMFSGATSFNSDLNAWDVSLVKNLRGMFLFSTSFNGDISSWNVSSVTNMNDMFSQATSFNGDLSKWDVSSAEYMVNMFRGATSFNGNIKDWNVSSVLNMTTMFLEATSFNSDVSNWDVSLVTNMGNMFRRATSFNSDVSNWNVSSVVDMQRMFHEATVFNSDLSRWDVSSVKNLKGMFYRATSFNSDISNWNVSSVTDMYQLFFEAASFNNDLSNWDVSSVVDMQYMFDTSNLSIVNYDTTLKGWSELITVPNNIELGAAGLKYCNDGETARIALTDKGWTFTGDSKSPDCN